jgi:truncated hemoglobin YjbI
LRGRKTCLFKEDLQAGTNKRERKTIDQFWGGRKIYLSRINLSD